MKKVSEAVGKAIEDYGGKENMLIQILLSLQKTLGWLSEETLREVSKGLEIPLSRVYQVATFYRAFSLSPKGKHTIRVCMGTACQVRGSPRILDKVQQLLDIGPGETTSDSKFTLETVNCLGCCALGPMMVVDEEYHGNLKVFDVEKVLKSYE